eukprot:jgi/Mesen1/6476/ME000330S05492
MPTHPRPETEPLLPEKEIQAHFSASGRRKSGPAAPAPGDAQDKQLLSRLPPLKHPGHSARAAEEPPSPQVTPYVRGGFFNLWTFHWVAPVLKAGSQKFLELPDIPLAPPNFCVESSHAKFQAAWARQLAAGDLEPGVVTALISCFWRPFAFTGLLLVLQTAVLYAGPLLLHRFVELAGARREFPWQEGPCLVGVLLAAKLVETGTRHQFQFRVSVLSMQATTALSAATYLKGLHLVSATGFFEFCGGVLCNPTRAGGITNYMAVDAQRVGDLALQLNGMWGLPLQIIVALVILFQVVGYAMLAGVGVMLAAMCISYSIATRQRASMRLTMACKDERMRATGEILSNMRVIKLQAWEETFEARIAGLRAAEMRWIRRYMWQAAANIFVLWFSPLLVSIATFGSCLLLGTPLTSARAFTAIATFRILQEPLRAFPQVITALTQAQVSIDRLNKFFRCPELDPNSVFRPPPKLVYVRTSSFNKTRLPGGGAASTDVCAVEVTGGTFSWDPEHEVAGRPTLRDINVQIQKGSLVAICGTVGSGKSSLLAALMGELTKLKGQVTVRGTTAYVAQSAWIQNASIRDNILFGRPFDAARYSGTLRACALLRDLEAMPAGDRTEIGERGINLSGGQKQRVQLARAVYQECDVYFLDDPFSAVDAHTGAHLFKECLKGALGGKTVIFVTHQMDLLVKSDLILVMKDGEIVQAGSYSDLVVGGGSSLLALVTAHESALQSMEARQPPWLATAPADREEDGADADAHGRGALDAALQQQLLAGGGGAHGPGGGRRADEPSEGELLRQRSGQLDGSPSWGQRKGAQQKDSKAGGAGGRGGLIQEEERERGRVSRRVYLSYMTKVWCGLHFPLLFLVLAMWQSLQVSSDWWLARSTSQSADSWQPPGVAILHQPVTSQWASLERSHPAGGNRSGPCLPAPGVGLPLVTSLSCFLLAQPAKWLGWKAPAGGRITPLLNQRALVEVTGGSSDEQLLPDHVEEEGAATTGRRETRATTSNTDNNVPPFHLAEREGGADVVGDDGPGGELRDIPLAAPTRGPERSLVQLEVPSDLSTTSLKAPGSNTSTSRGNHPQPDGSSPGNRSRQSDGLSSFHPLSGGSEIARGARAASTGMAPGEPNLASSPPQPQPKPQAHPQARPRLSLRREEVRDLLANARQGQGQAAVGPRHFFWVYSGLALGSGLFVLARTALIAAMGVATSQALFAGMLARLFRAPMAFFDATPSGRILNRVSRDQFALDLEIPFKFGGASAMAVQLAGTLLVTVTVTWQIAFLILPLAFVFFWLQGYYLATSRELTRLDSITRSPILHFFAESIAGSATVRAFNQERRFAQRNVAQINDSIRTSFHNFATNEWLAVRLEFISALLLSSAALLLVLVPSSSIAPGLVGLSLSYGLALNSCIYNAVVLYCQLENRMVSVERIDQYSAIASEAPRVSQKNRAPPPEWPSEGEIVIKNLEIRYRPDSPLVLRGVSCSIGAGERIGIVGRTGSGKTTLIQALFRLVEPASGSIWIDGRDVTQVGLKELRSRLGIIPQEPTLFDGSVRLNLDPLGAHSDLKIWEALEKCQLASVVRERDGHLDAPVGEGGSNWSVGQRQLLCLGRALLQRCRVLVLDEATASVDTATDAAMQVALRRAFGDGEARAGEVEGGQRRTTVLSMAHRIASVADSDRVLVLAAGRVAEFDTPANLLANPSSAYSNLVREYMSSSSSITS